MAMSIVLSRPETTVTPLYPGGHQVHLSAVDGCVVADCACGLHAESFTSQREVFDFLDNHRAGHIRAVPMGGFRAL